MGGADVCFRDAPRPAVRRDRPRLTTEPPLQRHFSGVSARPVSMQLSDRNGVAMEHYPRAYALSSLVVTLLGGVP